MPWPKSALGSLVGTAGAGFTALCCLGAPAALGMVSALGLGFLINDLVLLPLLVLLLFVTLWGLRRVRRRHRRPGPEIVGYVSAGTLVAGVAFGWSLLGYAAILGLLLASMWNVVLAIRVPGARGARGATAAEGS